MTPPESNRVAVMSGLVTLPMFWIEKFTVTVSSGSTALFVGWYPSATSA